MKVLCNACEAAEAAVLCCADEAALCAACDRAVHAANRLARKHQRLLLLQAPAAKPGPPKCDICQEFSGFFFCLEDRAVLCRNCDVAVHTANEFVSGHSRFLLTGVQVGLEPIASASPLAREKVATAPAAAESTSKSLSARTRSLPLCDEHVEQPVDWTANVPSRTASFVGGFMAEGLPDWRMLNRELNSSLGSLEESDSKFFTKRIPKQMLLPASTTPFSSNLGVGGNGADGGGAATGALTSAGFNGSLPPEWPLEEIFGFSDFNNSYRFNEQGSSKADSSKHGSSDGSAQYRSGEDDHDSDRFLGQVPEISWSVSPPTASGLHWERYPYNHRAETTAFVPDISRSPPSQFQCLHSPVPAKRRRQHY